LPTTFNFTHFTAVTPSGGSTGTATSWTVSGASQAGATSITENDDVLTYGSGGLGGYHNSNDLADSYTIPFANGSGAFLVYDGTYSVGGVEGIIVLADATGQHYLITDSDPGYTGGETFSSTGENFCFGPGTMIATPEGEKPVETLHIGDPVLTSTGDVVPVKWIGHQTLLRITDITGKRSPVQISQNALGKGLPHRDLRLTGDHAILIDDLLINASALVNHDTIRFLECAETPERLVYYHVETENHDVILANGVAAETFVDVTSRASFDNYQEYLDLYGVERIVPEMPAPRIATGRLVPDAIKARLGISAQAALPATPALALRA